MSVYPSIHQSICLSMGGGDPCQVQSGRGGYPSQVQLGGTPCWSDTLTHAKGATPLWVPPVRPGWGYPCWGMYPTLGTPLSDLAGGTPPGGLPPLGTPLSDLAGGYSCQGYPCWGDVPYLRPPIRPGQGGHTPPQVPPSDLVRGYPTSGTPCHTWLGGYPYWGGKYPTSGNRWST